MRPEIWGLIAICFVSSSAFPIGRVGNKVEIDNEGTVVEQPANYTDVAELDGHGFRFSDVKANLGNPLSTDINLRLFKEEFPEFANLPPKKIQAEFEADRVTRYSQIETSNGALSLVGESRTAVVAVSLCDDGRGFVAFASSAGFTKVAVIELLKSVHYKKACRIR